MVDLSMKEKSSIEELFGMGSGYVLDFSNNSFARFIIESINIDIYNGIDYEEYSSKANKLRQIINNENNYNVGKLLGDLIDYFEDLQLRKNNSLTQYETKKIAEIRNAAKRLFGSSVQVELPKAKEDNLQILIDDISNALQRNMPELVLDRLHTYATKLLRQICLDNGISVVDNNGQNYALHSLAGLLKNYYKNENIFESDFTILAIQNNITLFDKYNEIRNNKSYAHDNSVLNKIEAIFAVKTIANIIKFIDDLENFRKTKPIIKDDSIPF